MSSLRLRGESEEIKQSVRMLPYKPLCVTESSNDN